MKALELIVNNTNQWNKIYLLEIGTRDLRIANWGSYPSFTEDVM